MKRLLFFLCVVLISREGFSQDTIKLYLDKDYKITDKNIASIYRKAVIYNKQYFITDQYLNGKMINYGEYMSVNPFIADGLAKHYDEKGNLYSTGKYKNGRISGQWIYYANNIADTVDYTLVENYFNLIRDSCFKALNNTNKSSAIDTTKIKDDIYRFVLDKFHIPLRSFEDKVNCEFDAKLVLDTDGKIKCPEIIKSENLDYNYEILRLLFLYKCDQKIENQVQLSYLKNPPDLYDKTEPVFIFVEEEATFQGGNIRTFILWVERNLVYPLEAAKEKKEGKVIVQFIVNSKGSVVDAKVIRGVDPALDNEVLRCVNSSPAWEPAKQSGRPVKQQFVIPVSFILQ